MMLRALIVDDEPLARSLLMKYCSDSGVIEVAGEATNGTEALEKIEELNPDLVYLDIRMPGVSGISIPDMLEEPPLIIFTTAYDEYAVPAFEKNALDYLLKPVEYERFLSATQKASEKLASQKLLREYRENLSELNSGTGNYLTTISVKHKGDILLLKTADITHFEAMDDYVTIHLKEKKYMKKVTLKGLGGKLDPAVFARIHRSFIVNLSYAEKLTKDPEGSDILLLKNGLPLPVSASGLNNLKTRLA